MSAAVLLTDPAPDVEMAWGMPYDNFLVEAWPLLHAHWNEVGTHRDVLRFNPNHDMYRTLQRAGRLRILTVRVAGLLVGYLFVMTGPHPRDKAVTVARDDIFYVRPDFRRLRLGPKMIAEALRALEPDVDIIMMTEKVRRGGHGYLRRFGFAPIEITHSKLMPRLTAKGAAP